MEFSNTSPSCLGPAPHTGEFCGPVTTFGTSPTTGFMWTCTAYPNLTVTLTGLVVAWDVSGPTGVPDGVVDGLDEMITGPAEGSIQLLPGPNGEYTSFVYPPPMPATYAQLIAFPIAASIVPSVYLLPIQVGCI
jgi:hypothetical protein